MRSITMRLWAVLVCISFLSSKIESAGRFSDSPLSPAPIQSPPSSGPGMGTSPISAAAQGGQPDIFDQQSDGGGQEGAKRRISTASLPTKPPSQFNDHTRKRSGSVPTSADSPEVQGVAARASASYFAGVPIRDNHQDGDGVTSAAAAVISASGVATSGALASPTSVVSASAPSAPTARDRSGSTVSVASGGASPLAATVTSSASYQSVSSAILPTPGTAAAVNAGAVQAGQGKTVAQQPPKKGFLARFCCCCCACCE